MLLDVCRPKAGLDFPEELERLLVDTAVAPDPSAVSWINPRIQPGEVR